MHSIVRFTFWYLITCACYLSSVSALNGKNVVPAQEKQFSFVVAVALKNPDNKDPKDNYVCTGTVISKKLVLTAAHCFKDKLEAKKYEILAGSVDLQKSTANEVASYLIFNEWCTIKKKQPKFAINDIAIVILTEDIKPQIKPAIFSTKTNEKLYGTSGTLAGWGVTEQNERRSILQVGKVKILSNDECEERLKDSTKRFIPVESRMFCSFANPYVLTSCGDSGSPILRKGKKIIGINRGVCPKPGEVPEQQIVNLHLGLEGDYKEFVEDVMKNPDKYLRV